VLELHHGAVKELHQRKRSQLGVLGREPLSPRKNKVTAFAQGHGFRAEEEQGHGL
jgi:hypothetical protein